MAKGGIVEALYIGELLGLILIWIGYELCIRSGPPKRIAEANASASHGQKQNEGSE